MELFRVCLPCHTDWMQVAGKDVDVVPPPSSVACVRALAHSYLESARSAFSANYAFFFFGATAPSGPRSPYSRGF
jgi:hypothetical protein